jgi:CBS domain containing-hemolysin-like protein
LIAEPTAWLAGLVVGLVLLGSILAMAEASISRMTRVRALALRQEGRRNAALLEAIERDPAPYLNSIYLAVMFAQNGSAILVAMLAEDYFRDWGLTLVLVGFTLAYFVIVEAMSKTFGIQHSDRAALALTPIVWLLGRIFAWPTRLLIGIANVLLPGKGLAKGPFVSEEDIRSMADVGHEEGAIEEREKEMIHSVFHFGDRLVRELMVPRPDVIAVDIDRATVHDAHALVVQHGFTRLPAYRGSIDQTEGIVHAKDLLKVLLDGNEDAPLSSLLRPAHFVPGTKKASELMREMQQERFHAAMVTDEYGSVVGLVTLENLLEELVGDIAEEHEKELPEVEPLGDGRWRIDATVTIAELNELLGTEIPSERWNTVGGLMFGELGEIPSEGQAIELQGFRFVAERVRGRRVDTVLVIRETPREASGPG